LKGANFESVRTSGDCSRVVIEDDHEIAREGRNLLPKSRYLWKFARRSGHRLTVAILDIMMPGLSGKKPPHASTNWGLVAAQ